MIDKIMNWFWQFWNQWIKFRSVDPTISFARFLVKLGVGLMAPGGIWWLLVVFEIKPEGIPASFSVSVGPDTVTYTGLGLLLIGVILGLWGVREIKKKRASCLLYFRGLPGMHDKPPTSDLPLKYRYGDVSHLTLDTISVSNHNVLEHIKIFRNMLDEKLFQLGTDAPFLVFAGLAPVPLLYAAGVTISNRANLITMDYNRFEQNWHTLDAPDDMEEVEVSFPEYFSGTEIAIAIPFSINISESHIPSTFSDKTIWVKLQTGGPRTDSISSSLKLNRILKIVHDLIRNLRGRNGYSNIGKIHLFIAAQASTVFKLGTEYQPNAYPAAQIYHFDAGKGEYTWSVCVRNNDISLCK